MCCSRLTALTWPRSVAAARIEQHAKIHPEIRVAYAGALYSPCVHYLKLCVCDVYE